LKKIKVNQKFKFCLTSFLLSNKKWNILVFFYLHLMDLVFCFWSVFSMSYTYFSPGSYIVLAWTGSPNSVYLFICPSHHAWLALSSVDRHTDRKCCIAFLSVQLSTRHIQGNEEHSRCFQAVGIEELICQLVSHCT
jgi:hypothetical protein